MSIIKSHNVTLRGGDEACEIVLRPLTDADLPDLYRWNADPDVLYWAEGEDIEAYSPEDVEGIYGWISQENLCFAIEVNGMTVGECWLQKMNLPHVKAMYAKGLDVRRIDAMIGEKAFWGKGIGTHMLGMLIKYAFACEQVDVLHCLCEDYNSRSCRTLEKNGFTLVLTEKFTEPHKGEFQYHWRLTKDEYSARLK